MYLNPLWYLIFYAEHCSTLQHISSTISTVVIETENRKMMTCLLLSDSLIHSSYSTVEHLYCYWVSDLSPCGRNNSYLTREIVLFTWKERSDASSDFGCSSGATALPPWWCVSVGHWTKNSASPAVRRDSNRHISYEWIKARAHCSCENAQQQWRKPKTNRHKQTVLHFLGP